MENVECLNTFSLQHFEEKIAAENFQYDQQRYTVVTDLFLPWDYLSKQGM